MLVVGMHVVGDALDEPALQHTRHRTVVSTPCKLGWSLMVTDLIRDLKRVEIRFVVVKSSSGPKIAEATQKSTTNQTSHRSRQPNGSKAMASGYGMTDRRFGFTEGQHYLGHH